jgi:RimJ/RimL family protein N-acetyltransferase
VPEEITVSPIQDHSQPALELSVNESQLAFVSPVERMLAGALDHPGQTPFAILLGGRPVGFFILNFNRDQTRHYCFSDGCCGLEGYFIDQRFQGKGYGKQALAAIRQWLKAEQPEYQRLNLTVNIRNTPAIQAYLKGGFEDTGELYHGGRSGPQHIFTMKLTD